MQRSRESDSQADLSEPLASYKPAALPYPRHIGRMLCHSGRIKKSTANAMLKRDELDSIRKFLLQLFGCHRIHSMCRMTSKNTRFFTQRHANCSEQKRYCQTDESQKRIWTHRVQHANQEGSQNTANTIQTDGNPHSSSANLSWIRHDLEVVHHRLCTEHKESSGGNKDNHHHAIGINCQEEHRNGCGNVPDDHCLDTTADAIGKPAAR